MAAVVCVVYWNSLHGPRDLVGIGAHVGNVVLLFLICHRVFESSDGAPPGTGMLPFAGDHLTGWRPLSFGASAALVAAGCYAVHPLASQAVNYGVESSVPVSTLLCFASFGLFLAVYGGGASLSTVGRWSRLTGSYLAYGLALFMSPIGITFPVMLLVWDVVLGRGSGERSRVPWRVSGPDSLKHAPYVAAALGAVIFWQVVQNPVLETSAGAHASHSLLSHFLTQTTALALYCLKLVSVSIGGDPGSDLLLASSLLDLPVVLAVLILAGLGALVYRFRSQRALVFWSLWIPVCLLPTTYLVRQGPVVTEYRAYLSLAGFCALVGWGVVKGWQLFPLETRQLRVGRALGRLGTAMALLVVLVGLGSQARARNRVWPTEMPTPTREATLATAESEGARAAQVLLDSARTALRRNPTAGAYINLGLAHYRAGRFLDSIDASYQALEIEPDSAVALNNLCSAFNGLEDWEKGIEACTRALELDPGSALARNNLRWAQSNLTPPELEEMQAAQGEIDSLRSAAQSSGTAAAYVNLGLAYQAAGQYLDSIDATYQALEIEPSSVIAFNNLCVAFNSLGDWEKGVEACTRALELDPNFALARNNLNWARSGLASR